MGHQTSFSCANLGKNMQKNRAIPPGTDFILPLFLIIGDDQFRLNLSLYIFS